MYEYTRDNNNNNNNSDNNSDKMSNSSRVRFQKFPPWKFLSILNLEQLPPYIVERSRVIT